MKTAPRLLVAALVVAAAATTSACSASSAPAPSSSAAAITTNDINPVSRSEVTDGGNLQWALSSTIPNFNFYNINGALMDTYIVNTALLPRPFHYDASAQTSVNEDYFSSIEVTSDNPLTVTYTVNPKARWSDGSPIGAADFAGMWRANSGQNTDYQGWGTTGYDQISSVTEGSDPTQVVVTFAANFADWKSLFDPLIPASLTANPEAFNDGWANAPLVTAGPFIWGGEDQTAQTYTLTRNPDWWGDPAKLDSIVFRVYTDAAAAVGAFKTGQLDFSDILPDADQYAAAQSLPGVTVRTAGSPVYRMFTLNKADDLLKDDSVRKAIALGTDRVRMATLQVGKIGGSPTALQNHIFMPNQVGYQENCGDQCAYDPAAAKKLLTDDGWTLGSDGYFAKDGKTLEVSITIQSGRKNSANEAQIAQASLKEAGIKLTIDTVPVDDFFTKYVTGGNFQLATWTWNGVAMPVSGSLSMYLLDPDNIAQNYGRGGNETINDLLTRAVQAPTVDEENALANEADVELWKDASWLPLYQVPQNTAVRSTVANLGSPGFADIRFQDIGFTE
ncbi:ABC transporter family substrate-binding protein [Sphingomonas sp. BLCC-B65]|nr:ABC transporter family substrate-binding protein [Sphingomonas sp. BLCC-B65]